MDLTLFCICASLRHMRIVDAVFLQVFLAVCRIIRWLCDIMLLLTGVCTWYDSAEELCGLSPSNDIAIGLTV